MVYAHTILNMHVLSLPHKMNTLLYYAGELQVFYQRCYIVILSDLCNAVKKRLDEISCHTTITLQPLSHDSVFYMITINVHVRSKVSKKLLLRTTVQFT